MANVIAREAETKPALVSPFAFTSTELWAWVAATAVLVLARMPAFVYAHSVDDYSFNTHPQPIPHYFQMTLGDGRFGAGILLTVLHKLGLRQGTTPSVSALLAAAAAAAIGVLMCRLWSVRESRLAMAAVLGFLTLHPYLADSSAFQIITLINAIAFLSIIVALYCIATRPGLVLPAGLVFLSCSIYQPAVGYFLTAALATSLLDFIVEPEARVLTRWRLLARCLVVLAIALPVYLVANRIAIAVSGFEVATRFGLVPLSGIGNRIAQVGQLLRAVFLQYEPVLPFVPKLLLLALACGGSAAVAWRFRVRWTVLAAIPAAVMVLAIACVGVLAVVVDWWPAPRTMQAFAIFWAFVLVAGIQTAGPRVRSVLIGVALVVCVSFAGMTNHILDDRLRANLRDSMEIDRVIARLEALPGFAGVQSLAFSGNPWGYSSPLDTVYWDTNISSMAHPWSKTIFINEMTGYSFQQPTEVMKQAASAYCANAPLWPAEQSLAVRGDYAIVCLARQ